MYVAFLRVLMIPCSMGLGYLFLGGLYSLKTFEFSKPKPIYTKSPQAQKIREQCQEFMIKEKYSLAIDSCTRAIKIDPNFSEAYSLRGMSYRMTNKPDITLKDYQKALSLFQAQGYFQEAENMDKTIQAHKYFANLRKENAQKKP